MKTSREQFEEWVKNRANDLDYKHMECLLKTFDNGVYAVTWVDMAWEGWQASRQCIEVELPFYCDGYQHDKEIIDSLRDAGIKVKGA